MVDSNDRERIQEAAEELQKMVNVNTSCNVIVTLGHGFGNILVILRHIAQRCGCNSVAL